MDPKITTAASSSATSNEPECQENSDKRSTARRKPVRRDLAKRRQQNIQAQKRYREKVKQRLDHLNNLEARTASTTESSISDSGPSNSVPNEQQCFCQYIGQGTVDYSGESSVGFLDAAFSTSIPLAPSSSIVSWDPITPVGPAQLLDDELGVAVPQDHISYIDCGCSRGHIQVLNALSSNYRDRRVRNIAASSGADPYINTLRVERQCLIQAILFNCMHIGITEAMLCDDEAISPFFRPGSDSIDEATSDSVVTAVQGIFNSLKHDVRPTREQIMIVHCPMIDVLPFPIFRKNLIKNFNNIDWEELFHDLLNGLVCWGGAGIGKRDRDCSTGYISTGTPWDSRSWEARTWFLQKYWALLGGEEGELVRQSEWWRSMRGEEADLWLVQ